jgi:hypothetical protein
MEYRESPYTKDHPVLVIEESGHLWKPRIRGSAQFVSEQSIVQQTPPSTHQTPRTEFVNFIDFLKDSAPSDDILEQTEVRTSRTSMTSFKAKVSRGITGMQKLLSFVKPKKALKNSDVTLTGSVDCLSPTSASQVSSAPDIKMLSSSPVIDNRLSIQSEPSMAQALERMSLSIRTEETVETRLKSRRPKPSPTSAPVPLISKSTSVLWEQKSHQKVNQKGSTVFSKSIETRRDSLCTYEDFLKESITAMKETPQKPPSIFELFVHPRSQSKQAEEKPEHKRRSKEKPGLVPETPPQSLHRGLSRSLSREFENRIFETKRIDHLEHQRSHTRPIVETHRIYAKKDQRNTIVSPTGHPEVSQGKVNQYHLFETIGTGSYGRVVLARDDVSDEMFACKIISKSRLFKKWRFQSYQETLNMIRKEVAILKKVSNHPNIIKLYEVLDDSGDDNLYMFLEFCPNGPVMVLTPGQPAPPLPEQVALNYFRDTVLGLEYCRMNSCSAFQSHHSLRYQTRKPID